MSTALLHGGGSVSPPGLPPQESLRSGFAMALVVHALLVVALAINVRWRTQPIEPVAAQAELWASVPRVDSTAPIAAPPTPPPEPTPVKANEPEIDADIALKQSRAERKKHAAEEKAKLAKERTELAAKKAQERSEQERLETLRKENIQRMLGQAQTIGQPLPGAAAAAFSQSYQNRIRALIKANTYFSGDAPDNPMAEVEVRAASDGTITSKRLIRSSGNAEWDEAVLRAIDRTHSLPRDSDGRVPPSFIIGCRPKD